MNSRLVIIVTKSYINLKIIIVTKGYINLSNIIFIKDKLRE
jgi:hypothetical protein